jgi:hypothetical protein
LKFLSECRSSEMVPLGSAALPLVILFALSSDRTRCFFLSAFLSITRQHCLSLGVLSAEVAVSPSDTPNSVAILWTNDWPVADTTLNSYKRQTSMPTVRFEPAIPASERPQTQALNSATPRVCRDVS